MVRTKDKEIRILNEKLRIAEEIIGTPSGIVRTPLSDADFCAENMDTLLKGGGGEKKKEKV